MKWMREDFELAYATGPYKVAGYTYNGLGIHRIAGAKKLDDTLWVLTHLGTGYRLATIRGSVGNAFPIATEIAEAGDWDFLSLQGWRDRFPDGPMRLSEICERNSSRIMSYADGSKPHDERAVNVAQQIASNRP